MIAAEGAPPVIEIFDELMPPEEFSAACRACIVSRWEFGHESQHDDPLPFWAMDLTGDASFDAVWQHARARCEALAGRALRVIRQYATGHTYGLGGRPHSDDHRAGCFTLLYYPMPEWKTGWEGETVFYDAQGDVIKSVLPRPNRAVLFDSRIVHAGHAPGRLCSALRIAVAFKLEPAALSEMPSVDSFYQANSASLLFEEVSRAGVERVYTVRIPHERVGELVRERLLEAGEGLHMSGFRPGKIPIEVLEQRFGLRAEEAVRNAVAVEAAQQLLALGNLTSATAVVNAPGSADVFLQLTVTHLPALPDPQFELVELTRLTASDKELEGLLDIEFRQQVLDHLDTAYRFTLAPVLVNRELQAIHSAVEEQLALMAGADRSNAEAELRGIAERRVRLGAVILEMARRFSITVTEVEALAVCIAGESFAQARARLTEQRVVDHLIAKAKVTTRLATADELHELSSESA